jgi:hypothetical protein
MKNTRKLLFNLIAMGSLSVLTAQAGNPVVLEGFENGYITNSQGQVNLAAFTHYGNRTSPPYSSGNPAPNVQVSIYTADGPNDPRVTEGTHSAKIVFPTDGFGNDFSVSLSDAACSLLENAACSNQPARYIFRYDVILEGVNQIQYFNQHYFLNNTWNYVRSGGGVQTNYEGKQFEIDSYSVAIELPEVGMPTNAFSGTNAGDFPAAGMPGLVGFSSDQFVAVTEPLTNFTIYVDNFRLVDTYATPTTTPSTYELQSFETGMTGVTNLTPSVTTLSLYTTNGEYNPTVDEEIPGVCSLTNGSLVYPGFSDPPYFVEPAQQSDFAVTQGTNCLQAVNNFAGYTLDAFSMSLAGTQLQQILNLNLTPAQLAHYTIRWDLTSPYVPEIATQGGAGDGDYFQLDYNCTTGSILPMSNGRRQSDNQLGLQRQTYSMTLDQILYWGTFPSISVSTSMESSTYWENDPFYFDNFRLINTAPQYTEILGESYNPVTRQLIVTWLSDPSQTYSVKFASSLSSGFNTTLATGVPSGGVTTTKTVTVPAGTAGYVRISAP